MLSLGALLAIVPLYMANTSTILPSLSPDEAILQSKLVNDSFTLSGVFSKPVWLPYNLVLLIAQSLNFDSILSLRLISSIFILVSVASFYYILRSWLTKRLAILSTLLFATSSWTIHIARIGTPDALFTCSILALAFAIWLQHTRRRRLILLLVALSLLFVYIPGFVWLIFIGIIWQRKRLLEELRRAKLTFQVIFSLLSLAILAPLFITLVVEPRSLFGLLGLPDTIPSMQTVLTNSSDLFYALFIEGIDDQQRWLPGTPLLSIFSTFMFVIGLYKCWLIRKLDRTKVVIGGIVFWSLLIAIGGPIRLAVLVPYIFAVVGLGITLMLQQWFTVFPNNNIARSSALFLMYAVVFVNVGYNISHYFIAWAQAPETTQIFSIPNATSDTMYVDQPSN